MTKELKPFTFEDHMREYETHELRMMTDESASCIVALLTDTQDIYEQFEGYLWAIISKEGERQNKLTLQILIEADTYQAINDGDNLRQLLVWYCMEHVARAILDEQARRG